MDGKWTGTAQYETIVDPLNGEAFIQAPLTSVDEIKPFVKSSKACPKSGLHNPFKHPDRYLMLGEVTAKAAGAPVSPRLPHAGCTLLPVS